MGEVSRGGVTVELSCAGECGRMETGGVLGGWPYGDPADYCVRAERQGLKPLLLSAARRPKGRLFHGSGRGLQSCDAVFGNRGIPLLCGPQEVRFRNRFQSLRVSSRRMMKGRF